MSVKSTDFVTCVSFIGKTLLNGHIAGKKSHARTENTMKAPSTLFGNGDKKIKEISKKKSAPLIIATFHSFHSVFSFGVQFFTHVLCLIAVPAQTLSRFP